MVPSRFFLVFFVKLGCPFESGSRVLPFARSLLCARPPSMGRIPLRFILAIAGEHAVDWGRAN